MIVASLRFLLLLARYFCEYTLDKSLWLGANSGGSECARLECDQSRDGLIAKGRQRAEKRSDENNRREKDGNRLSNWRAVLFGFSDWIRIMLVVIKVNVKLQAVVGEIIGA